MGSKFRRVVDIGRQRETAGDGGSILLDVYSLSKHERRGDTGSNREQEDATGSRRSILPNHSPDPLFGGVDDGLEGRHVLAERHADCLSARVRTAAEH